MRRAHVVSVDYAELAAYVQQYYYLESQDDPLPYATFKFTQGMLAQHVEKLMDESATDDNPALTQILLRNHLLGSVTDIMVSYSPGRFERYEGQAVILPLILIEIDY